MAVDMTTEPWIRLPKIAPPGTTDADMNLAAERYSATEDVYAAAADLWEEAAVAIDITMSDTTDAERQPVEVTQNGIKVLYGADSLDTQSTRMARAARYMERSNYYRAKAKPHTFLVRQPADNPWRSNRCECWEDDYDEDTCGCDGGYIDITNVEVVEEP